VGSTSPTTPEPECDTFAIAPSGGRLIPRALATATILYVRGRDANHWAASPKQTFRSSKVRCARDRTAQRGSVIQNQAAIPLIPFGAVHVDSPEEDYIIKGSIDSCKNYRAIFSICILRICDCLFQRHRAPFIPRGVERGFIELRACRRDTACVVGMVKDHELELV